MLKHKIKLILRARLDELEMNLANNYKDAAHSALSAYLETLEQLHRNGEISEKDYAKYLKTGIEYKQNMTDYHH